MKKMFLDDSVLFYVNNLGYNVMKSHKSSKITYVNKIAWEIFA
jgi:hypothetical protein